MSEAQQSQHSAFRTPIPAAIRYNHTHTEHLQFYQCAVVFALVQRPIPDNFDNAFMLSAAVAHQAARLHYSCAYGSFIDSELQISEIRNGNILYFRSVVHIRITPILKIEIKTQGLPLSQPNKKLLDIPPDLNRNPGVSVNNEKYFFGFRVPSLHEKGRGVIKPFAYFDWTFGNYGCCRNE